METSKELKELIKPNINEGALEQYLMSRGINPKFVSTQTKISHAKSSAFIKWKNDHMHENHIAISMGKMLDDEGSMVLNQIEELERGCAMIREYIGKDYEKQLPAWVQSKVTLATDYMSTVGNYLSSKNEEVVSEVSSELLDRYKEKAKKSADELTAKGQHKKSTDRWMGVMKATGKQIDKTTDNIRKTLSKEEVVSETKKDDGYTKSARMIKAIYGKLPKTKTSDTKNNVGDKAQAAAVLTGGKTLTGQTRDTLEIDPIMRKGDPLELQKQQKNLR